MIKYLTNPDVKSSVEDVLAETKVTPEEEKAINELNIEDNE